MDILEIHKDDVINQFLKLYTEGTLCQYVNKRTRIKDNNTLFILDLVFSNGENLITQVYYLAPIGKSDHIGLKVIYGLRGKVDFVHNRVYEIVK